MSKIVAHHYGVGEQNADPAQLDEATQQIDLADENVNNRRNHCHTD